MNWFAFAALAWAATASAAPEKPKPPAIVATSEVVAAELHDLLTYPARVTPKINTQVLAEVDGIVTRIATPLGQSVSRGRPILVLQHTDPVYKYAPMQVLSPVNGIVSALEVTEGTQVTRGQRLASVTDPRQVRLTVEIPALDLQQIRRGHQGEFRVSGRSESVPVAIRGVSPFVDPATGTATAELDLLRGAIPPGLLGQVSFKANVRKGVQVPDHAVFYKAAETFVRIVDAGGKARHVAVKLGQKARGQVEVLEGLQPGQQLVERTSRYVGDGEAVEAQPAAKKSEAK